MTPFFWLLHKYLTNPIIYFNLYYRPTISVKLHAVYRIKWHVSSVVSPYSARWFVVQYCYHSWPASYFTFSLYHHICSPNKTVNMHNWKLELTRYLNLVDIPAPDPQINLVLEQNLHLLFPITCLLPLSGLYNDVNEPHTKLCVNVQIQFYKLIILFKLEKAHNLRTLYTEPRNITLAYPVLPRRLARVI